MPNKYISRSGSSYLDIYLHTMYVSLYLDIEKDTAIKCLAYRWIFAAGEFLICYKMTFEFVIRLVRFVLDS